VGVFAGGGLAPNGGMTTNVYQILINYTATLVIYNVYNPVLSY